MRARGELFVLAMVCTALLFGLSVTLGIISIVLVTCLYIGVRVKTPPWVWVAGALLGGWIPALFYWLSSWKHGAKT